MLQQRISVRSSYTKNKCPKLINQLPKIAALVFITLLFLLGMQRAAFAVMAAVERSEQEWKTFRDTYPFHLQVVGLTPPLGDQSRVLIISEPPPHIKPEYFQELADSVGGKFLVKTHPVGYDGWTRDAVLALPPLDQQKLSELLARMYRKLYSTTYKANVVRLPLEAPPKNQRSLDLSVSVGDLNSWLSNEKFTSILGGNPQSLSKILSDRQSGVFISTQRGLVIWSIPRDRDLANYSAEARQFFLDSDLIVGAVANNRQLAIIARERVESILRLPPLRVETALMLAAAKRDRELGQSYERNQLFAGNLPGGKDKDWDWAPIYLSDSLINTEFGSLLNVTDQLLKSWSLNGEIEYINFNNYPKPPIFPPFPRPMRKIAEEAGSIQFNWNTDGAGYATTTKSYVFYALNRTGALPTTYGAKSEAVKTYEKIAYDYFSGLGNPDLSRVVQYTQLYQIFYQFDIKSEKSVIQGSLHPGNEVLKLAAKTFLEKLQRLTPDEQAQKISKLRFIPQYENELNTKITNLRDVVNDATARWKGAAILEISSFLADRNSYKPAINDPKFKNWRSSNEPTIYSVIGDPNVREILGADIDEVKESYVNALSKDSRSWIRTPSIVLSKDVVSKTLVGGHNLTPTITLLKASSDIPIGKIRFDEATQTILYNPNDFDKIHSLSRKLATELSGRLATKQLVATEIKSITNSLERTLSKASPNKSLTQALNLPSESSATQVRGLTPTLEPPTSGSPIGWRGGDPPSPQEVQWAKIADIPGTQSVFIKKSSNGYRIIRVNNTAVEEVIEAHTILNFLDVLDQLPGASPTRLHLNGFTQNQVRGIKLTFESRNLTNMKTLQIVSHGDNSFEKNIAFLQRSYDWNKAKIRDVGIEKLSGGPYKYKQTVELEVASLRVRIITFLKELPEQVAQRIKSIIQSIFDNPSSQSLSPEQFALLVNKKLKNELSNISVEIQYKSEIEDFIIVHLLKQEVDKRWISYDH